MKRCISAILTVLLLCTLLTGCHGSRGSKAFSIPSELDTSRQIEITFWAKNDTNKAQTLIYQQAITDFQALYPNITVNLRLYTDYNTIYNDVITNIATGTTPNVCITYPDHIATYLEGSNVVVPLDDLMADENYGLGGSKLAFTDGPANGEIIPQYLEECKLNGTTYALPYMRSTEVCYINKTFVEKLGYTLPEKLTWDFIWEVSDAATAKDASGNFIVNGQNVLIPFIYKSTDNMMIQLLKQANAGYSDTDGSILLFNDTTTGILKELAEHVKKGAFSTFTISGYPANFLDAGQCIFAVDSTAGSTWMGSDAPLSDIPADKFVEFETAVMTVPQLDPENPKMISQGPSVCVFNKEDPQIVLASWLFAQYLLTDGVQTAYAETEGYVPVTSKAQNCDAYQEYLSLAGTDNSTHYSVKIAASKLLMENTANTFTTPVFNGSASLRNAAGSLIENVTKSIRRKKTVDDAFISSLYSDTIALYRLDQTSGNSSGKKAELGPLPTASMVLLISLACIWVLIAAAFIRGKIKAKKQRT